MEHDTNPRIRVEARHEVEEKHVARKKSRFIFIRAAVEVERESRGVKVNKASRIEISPDHDDDDDDERLLFSLPVQISVAEQ